MKSFILALALLCGGSLYASTTDSYSLPITGVKTEENFSLNAVQTKTLYRQETVADTCWRTVFAGYQQICRQEPQVICYMDQFGRQYCSTQFITRCSSEPQYRQEAYTCYKTVSVPYEVFDHNVKANVNVKVVNVPGDVTAPHNTCNADFSITGDRFQSTSSCQEFIILATRKAAEESRAGDTVTQNQSVELTLLDANKISAPVRGGIAQMRVEGQTLVFRTGDLTKNPNFTLKLFVERRKILQKDETIFNRNLIPTEYTFEKTGDEYGIVKVNLSKLFGGINRKKKHTLRVDLNVNTNLTGAINSVLPNFSATESTIVND